MFVAPGAEPSFGYKLTRDAAQQIAGNWSRLLLNGALLVVAGFLIFSIDWSIRSLATFIGVLFIVEGVAKALTVGRTSYTPTFFEQINSPQGPWLKMLQRAYYSDDNLDTVIADAKAAMKTIANQ